MCSVSRGLMAAGTMGMSETVRGVAKVAKGDISGVLDIGTFGMGSALAPKAPTMPAMPQLPNMSQALPGAPPPPAPTASGQTTSPFNLSIRPRRSQSLRTDRGGGTLGAGSSGLNIPM
jgi:hypothetical protein